MLLCRSKQRELRYDVFWRYTRCCRVPFIQAFILTKSSDRQTRGHGAAARHARPIACCLQDQHIRIQLPPTRSRCHIPIPRRNRLIQVQR